MNLVVLGSGTSVPHPQRASRDRKSTRLNSSHDQISYAVFCLKKKKKTTETQTTSVTSSHDKTARGIFRIKTKRDEKSEAIRTRKSNSIPVSATPTAPEQRQHTHST